MARDDPGREIEREVRREVARIQEEAELAVPTATGRCRVCLHPESRTKVNTLLGYGMGNSEILKFVSDINAKRAKNNKITLDSIRNHKQRHFPVQAQTTAGFRRILERRKQQLSDEHEDAVTHLLTGMGYLDVVAQKGWQHLIDEDTVVDFEIGLKAQLQLEHMQREGAVEEKIAQMRREVSILQQSVIDVVAENHPELLDEIMERIGELSGTNARKSTDADEPLDVQVVDDFYDQDDDDEASPTFSSDDGDSIEE